jgi:hypothetical protein
MTTRRSRSIAEPVKPTSLNLWVLKKAIREGGGRIRKVAPTSAPHLRRCIAAGLLEQTSERVGRGYAWKLTSAGEEAVKTVKG